MIANLGELKFFYRIWFLFQYYLSLKCNLQHNRNSDRQEFFEYSFSWIKPIVVLFLHLPHSLHVRIIFAFVSSNLIYRPHRCLAEHYGLTELYIMKTTLFKITIFSLLIVSCEKFDTSAQYSYQPPDSINVGIEF